MKYRGSEYKANCVRIWMGPAWEVASGVMSEANWSVFVGAKM